MYQIALVESGSLRLNTLSYDNFSNAQSVDLRYSSKLWSILFDWWGRFRRPARGLASSDFCPLGFWVSFCLRKISWPSRSCAVTAVPMRFQGLTVMLWAFGSWWWSQQICDSSRNVVALQINVAQTLGDKSAQLHKLSPMTKTYPRWTDN